MEIRWVNSLDLRITAIIVPCFVIVNMNLSVDFGNQSRGNNYTLRIFKLLYNWLSWPVSAIARFGTPGEIIYV